MTQNDVLTPINADRDALALVSIEELFKMIWDAGLSVTIHQSGPAYARSRFASATICERGAGAGMTQYGATATEAMIEAWVALQPFRQVPTLPCVEAQP